MGRAGGAEAWKEALKAYNRRGEKTASLDGGFEVAVEALTRREAKKEV